MFSADDHRYMALALRLAERGLFSTDPNPRVGAVLVKAGQVIGEGFHKAAGQSHAETIALAQAGAAARGSTAYVTLEPCNHFGRTPPCSQALVEAGVSEVVVAMTDPDPRTAGAGLQTLTQAGVRTRAGLMEAAARALNVGFVSRHERRRPWVRVKLATSLDGQTASADGQSQWITGPEARADVQQWRARASAVVTGIGTVMADDPLMDARHPQVSRQPLRMVIDSAGRLPATARILDRPGDVHVFSAAPSPNWVDGRLTWHRVKANGLGRVDLEAVMAVWQSLELNEVHIESGPVLAGAWLETGLVDELLVYQAPVLLGQGRPLARLASLKQFEQRMALTLMETRQLGQDLRLRFRLGAPKPDVGGR
jgi:diaminohydroxyphosphoribosylaminopyrimidine deaminase/5-amino-6-(5-phosphoribosylamino)uracil reductase